MTTAAAKKKLKKYMHELEEQLACHHENEDGYAAQATEAEIEGVKSTLEILGLSELLK